MASTNKTSLGFNQWIGADKPKWADFNADNALLDEELKKRAEIDSDGKVKQEAKNSAALGGKSYSQLFDAAGAAKNALALSGHTYTQLFDETGAVQNALKLNGKGYGELFDNEGRANKALDSLSLGGVDAAKYATISMVELALMNGFKTEDGKSVIKGIKIGNFVAICGGVVSAATTENDRAIFIIPEEMRPSYTVDYSHYQTTGNIWIRERTGECMAQSRVKDIEIYLVYITD